MNNGMNDGVNNTNLNDFNNMLHQNNNGQQSMNTNMNQTNYNQPQSQFDTQINNQYPKNNKPNNGKIIKIIIGIIFALIVIVLIAKVFKRDNSSGNSVLPKSKSQYEKICTLYQDYQGQSDINLTFGLYQKENQVFQDTTVVWEGKNGKINIPEGKTEEEMVSTFATITGMMISFDGGTVSNVKNYYKNGKVYLTNTRSYSTDEFSSVEMLAEDIMSSGATCK